MTPLSLLLPLLACAGTAKDPGDTSPPDGETAPDSADTGPDDSADPGDTSDTSHTGDTFDTSHTGDTSDTSHTGDSGDSADTDCFPTTWYADVDRDDFGDEATTEYSCEPTLENPVVRGGDCDDTNPGVNPDADEVCDDGLDNDCDPLTTCGLSGPALAEDADVYIPDVDGEAEYGHALAVLDDLDGDGLPDLAVGAPGPGSRYTGPGAAWTVTELVSGDSDDVGVRIDGTSGDDEFGSAVADAGDLDGDGLSDLWVGAPSGSTEGPGAWGVYLFPSPAATTDSAAATVVLRGDVGEYGASSLSSGDLDGDGVRDLSVGNGWGGTSRSGELWVVSGAAVASGPIEDAAFAWTGEESGDTAHFHSVGDLDGDGADDLLAGAYAADSSAGRAYLVRGPLSGPGSFADADLVFTGEARNDAAGRTTYVLEDLDGDGARELAVGAPSYPAGAGRGRLYVHPGVGSGTVALADAWLTVTGSTNREYLGSSATSGDLDGDGAVELVVGTPYLSDSSGRLGVAYLYAGVGPGSLDESGAYATVWGTVGAQFAYHLVSADFDGDDIDDLAVGADLADAGGALYLYWGGGL